MMRKVIYIACTLLVSSLLLVTGGCGERKTRFSVVGSTSVQPVAETLAESYTRKHPNMLIDVQGGGSSAGIKAATDGTAEIGSSSRGLKPGELKAGFTVREIALDGIAIVCNPKSKIENLTLEQLRKIYSGEVGNWSEVGGSAGAIMVVNREEGSGTRGAFTELVMGEIPVSPKSIVQGSTGAVRQSVAGNQNAIGYISFAAMDASVKTLKIDGVDCSVANIKRKSYPIVRPFIFLYKQTADNGVKAFVAYVLGEGQKIVAANGLIPVK
jgi:phosphate transport system substrate-binding protein